MFWVGTVKCEGWKVTVKLNVCCILGTTRVQDIDWWLPVPVHLEHKRDLRAVRKKRVCQWCAMCTEQWAGECKHGPEDRGCHAGKMCEDVGGITWCMYGKWRYQVAWNGAGKVCEDMGGLIWCKHGPEESGAVCCDAGKMCEDVGSIIWCMYGKWRYQVAWNGAGKVCEYVGGLIRCKHGPEDSGCHTGKMCEDVGGITWCMYGKWRYQVAWHGAGKVCEYVGGLIWCKHGPEENGAAWCDAGKMCEDVRGLTRFTYGVCEDTKWHNMVQGRCVKMWVA